jgi:periplasmic protein TonB
VSVMTVDPYGRDQAKDTGLWIAAALIVATLHVGLVTAYLLLRPTPEGMATAPVIDVAFVPAEDKQSEATPEVQPAEPTPKVEQSDLPPPKDESVATHESVTEPEQPPARAETVPPPEPTPPPVALQVPEPLPELAHPDDITVAPPPPPKPAEQAPEAKKPVPERATPKRTTDEKVEKETKHKQAPPKTATEQQASKRARLAMAPNPGADSEGARAGRLSWQSEVAARIRGAASYPSGSTASGTARVGVTIDRNGRLVSRRLAGSSGSAVLDNAALAIVARAAPYPRFLPGMTEAQISLTVPLHLHTQ